MERALDISIINLDYDHLPQASKLADEIFFYEDPKPSHYFEISLDERLFESFNSSKKLYSTVEYFISVNSTGKVLGTCGLYSLNKDCNNSLWVGWFCVDEEYREMGIGRMQLQFLIDSAKKREMKFLKLYTSDRIQEAKAQNLYENMGFIETHREGVDNKEFKIIYRTRKL